SGGAEEVRPTAARGAGGGDAPGGVTCVGRLEGRRATGGGSGGSRGVGRRDRGHAGGCRGPGAPPPGYAAATSRRGRGGPHPSLPILAAEPPDLALHLVRVDPPDGRRARAGRLDPGGVAGGPRRTAHGARRRPARRLSLSGDPFRADLHLLTVGALAVQDLELLLAPDLRGALGAPLRSRLAPSSPLPGSIGHSGLRSCRDVSDGDGRKGYAHLDRARRLPPHASAPSFGRASPRGQRTGRRKGPPGRTRSPDERLRSTMAPIRRLLPLLGAGVGAAAGILFLMRRPAARASRHPVLAGGPLLIAHRGGAGLAPENTLEAFRQAVDDWAADMIELDVHATADGYCVVIHDPTVDRTTDGTGRVAEMTLAELKRLDAGYRFSTDD